MEKAKNGEGEITSIDMKFIVQMIQSNVILMNGLCKENYKESLFYLKLITFIRSIPDGFHPPVSVFIPECQNYYKELLKNA